MSDKEIEIVLRLRDEVTKTLQGVQSNLYKFSNQVKEMGLAMRATGREISMMGTTMTMLGTAITAPLIAAYKEAGKYNADIAEQLDQTRYVFQNLAISIGTALLPVMKQMTDQVAKAVDWWNNLDKATRDKLVQDIFQLGENLLKLGVAFVVVGKSITFLANLTLLGAALIKTNLITLGATVGFGVLALTMWKCKEAGDAVVNTLQLIARWSPLANIARIFSGKNPDEFFGKQGSWAKGFDDFKQQIKDLQKFIQGIGNDPDPDSKKQGGTLWSGFMLGIAQAKIALGSFRDWGIQAGADLAKGIQDNFKTFFVDAFHGQLKTVQEYFAALGDSLINIFADVCAKIIEKWIATEIITGWGQVVTGIGSLFGGGLGGISQGVYGSSNFVSVPMNTVATPYYHFGGIVAHEGLNLKSDEIPIIAQTGERVLSRSQNKEYEKGTNRSQQTINIYPTVAIKAWDFADVYGHKDEIEAIVSQSIDLNRLRKIINNNR